MADLVAVALSPRAAATEVNTSQSEDASIGAPSQLLLEILIVLMCVAAVTGTQQKEKIVSFFNYLI